MSSHALLLRLGLGDLLRVDSSGAGLLSHALGLSPDENVAARANDLVLQATTLNWEDDEAASDLLARLMALDALVAEDAHRRRNRLNSVLSLLPLSDAGRSDAWRHMRARFRLRVSMVEIFTGTWQNALVTANDVMEQAVERDDARLFRQASWLLTACLRETGDIDGSIRVAQEWVQRATGEAVEQIPALFALATAWVVKGERKLAEEGFARALALCATVGSPRYESLCLSNLGHLAEQSDELEKAYAWFEQVLSRCPADDLWLHQRTLATLGQLGAVLGKPDAAEWLDRAEALNEGPREIGIDARILLGRARLAADKGENERVSVLVQRALSLVSGQPSSLVLAWVRQSCDEVMERLAGQRAAVRVHIDGQWFRVPGQPAVDLSRFPAQTRILAALARAYADGSGRDIHALFEAGWPGQRSVGSSSNDRVYTAVRLLRRAGLDGTLAQGDGLYRLVSVIVDDAPLAHSVTSPGSMAQG